MYVEEIRSKQNGKVYKSCLMRETCREDGKVKYRTIANLSGRSHEEIQAIRLALRYKGELKEPKSASDWRLENRGH